MSDSAKKTRVAVIGAGPGGYPAAFIAADHGMDVTLIDMETNPGGVCLFRGCIPSKALLHVAKLLNESREAANWGVTFQEPQIDVDRLRSWKESVVSRLTGGLGQLAKTRKVKFLQGRATLTDANHLVVQKSEGGEEQVEFDYAILSTGSQPIIPGPLKIDSPRVMDSTDALRLEDIPEKLLVIGGGYIGLELGSVYASMGSKVSVVEATPNLLPGVDRDLVEFLQRRLESRFDKIMLRTKVTEMKEVDDKIRVKLLGIDVEQPEMDFDKVLIAVGRRPSSANLGLENVRVEVDNQGFIVTDNQRRTGEPTIFAIGDVAGQPMLAHKATYEARIAVEAIADMPSAFDPQAIPAVVFTDPEIAWAGLSETQALENNIPIKITRFPWAASGRATSIDRNDGITKLILDPVTERILGIGISGVGAGELIGEGVLAVEMGARADDLRMTIHAHPTLSETVMEAAEAFFGTSPHFYQKK